jgi:hypothetical protein
MTSPNERKFKRNYKKHLQHLKLKGLQPKTIEAYARAIRRIGDCFKHDIDVLRRFWSVHRNPVLLFPNRLPSPCRRSYDHWPGLISG